MNKLAPFLLIVANFLAMTGLASASSPSLGAGTVSGAPGASVTVPITFTAGSTGVTALQFVVGVPVGWSIASASAGPAAVSASKSLNANSGMLIVFGVNQTAISTGVIANVQINIPASAGSGTYTVSISGVVFSASDSTSVPAATSLNGAVTVQSSNANPPSITSFSASPASIAAGSSSSLSWTVNGATTLSISPNVGIVSGTSVSVTPSATTTYTLTASNSVGSVTATATVIVPTATATPGAQFVPSTPCRIVDTRNAAGPFGGPEMAANSTRSFVIPSSPCGIPASAVAYSLNVTVVPNAALGYLTVWPTGQPQPYVSTLNSDGRIKANAAIVPAGTGGSVSVYVTDWTHVILDIDGYFVPSGSSPSSLAFYPVAPCRIADTRQLAGPYLTGSAAARSFPILSSSCSIPSTARAYSLNFTAVPHGPLSYITVWPTGQNQPLASTLNASTGAITANAALIPAGTGRSISVYASNDTDLIIDVDGYFGPPGTGGLSLYTVTPCRVLDTRNPPGSAPLNGTLGVNVYGSACATAISAQAYVLNSTVIPPAAFQYLTLWPFGQNRPVFSTLNAPDGAITSNMAIVPTSNGFIDAFGSDPTQLVLDISAYFAP